MSLRLFCVPYAGGSTAVYRAWRPAVPGWMELCPVELPGRGHRIAEPPLATLDALVHEICAAVAARPGGRYALLGHSLGALLAFEAARVLQARGLPPLMLVVSGHGAPHAPRRRKPMAHLPDAAFLTELVALGGTPPGLLADEELAALVLPALRADFTVADAYRPRPGPLLTCPISVFGGADDSQVRLTDLEGWRLYTTESCVVRVLPGGHFFVHDMAEDILRPLRAREPSAR
ncbi:thioesterase [Actinomadura soli]|uniref:Thioesterase n=1 Tax=Actinomadura soli TaxID=2508997 RepID=A0A5C4J2I3_9ACTN|nr:alpha/beta fold hydrolase [Actinomadura soli]TMQ90976.1 thioesterase [Actinomadura soli]